jgi:dTMP kinase
MPLFQRYRYEPENRGTMIDHRAVICLFLADRLQHAHEMILPALDRGQWVVCHRYYYNLIAEARAIDLHDSWITHGCDALPQPDSAVILDADLDTIVQRISARTDPRSGFVDRRPHLEHVLEEYRRLARELAIPIVSSSKLSADEMVEQVWSIVCGCIARTV